MPESYTKPNGSLRGKKLFAPDPRRFIFNIDTLWYTYDAENYDAVMQEWLQEVLQLGKELAEEGEIPEPISVSLARYETPVEFDIQPNGQRPIYTYQIRNHDMAIFFAKKRRNDGTFPVKVQINQFKLWELGVRDAFLESLEVLAQLGFIHEASKPNRIDPCVHSDQFQWTLADLRDLDYPRNPQRTNKPSLINVDPFTGEFETAYVGDRSRLQLRIYNKSIEIQKKGKDYFREIYKKRGMDPDRVWNVEFEIHREWMKGFADAKTGEVNIFDTMDFLLRLDGLSMLWTHLFTTFTHNSAFWRVIQKADSQQFLECRDYLFRLKDIDTTKEREVAQIRGRLQKLILNEELPDDADFMVEAMKIFTTMFHEYEAEKEKDFEKDVLKKRKLYMDTQMLKKKMAEKRRSVDKLEMLQELLQKRKLHNASAVLVGAG